MHSWVINDDSYYYNMWEHLHNSVPEFKSIWEKDDVYLTMFEFGEFLVKNINDNEISKKGFHFINEAIEKGGNKTEDVIVLEVFHQLYEDPKCIQKAREVLSPQALAVFDKAYEEYKT